MRIVPVNKQVSRIFAFNGKKKSMFYTQQHTKMYSDIIFSVPGTSLLLLEFIVIRDILTQAVAMFLDIQSALK